MRHPRKDAVADNKVELAIKSRVSRAEIGVNQFDVAQAQFCPA